MATHHKLLNIHVEGRVRLGNLDLDLDFWNSDQRPRNLKTYFNADKPVLGFPIFLGRGEVCGHTRKDLNCFQEQLSRKHTHNKQEKTKHCLLEQFYKSFFSFPKVPNRTVIKEMRKILIWIHLLKPTSWTDFSEGGDEIRFEFRVRLQNLKSLFLMQSNAP